jgi:hypothetical protein
LEPIALVHERLLQLTVYSDAPAETMGLIIDWLPRS